MNKYVLKSNINEKLRPLCDRKANLALEKSLQLILVLITYNHTKTIFYKYLLFKEDKLLFLNNF